MLKILRWTPKSLRAFSVLKLNTRKVIGPVNICGRLLKSCAFQLSVVFSQLFAWSLKENTVPFTWKTSGICPVPKKLYPSCLNDYRPIALTSVVMKYFKRIIFHQLMKHEAPFRPIAVCVQAQQKHRRRNTHSFAQCIYSS